MTSKPSKTFPFATSLSEKGSAVPSRIKTVRDESILYDVYRKDLMGYGMRTEKNHGIS